MRLEGLTDHAQGGPGVGEVAAIGLQHLFRLEQRLGFRMLEPPAGQPQMLDQVASDGRERIFAASTLDALGFLEREADVVRQVILGRPFVGGAINHGAGLRLEIRGIYPYIPPVLQRVAFLPSCDPISRPRLPTGERWAFELKFDGFRLQIQRVGGKVAIFSRRGHNWSERFPSLVAGLMSLPNGTVIDGELVMAAGEGIAPFADVHRAVARRQEDGLVVFGFDLLVAAGRDVRGQPYADRTRRLGQIIRRAQIGRLYYSEPFANGAKLLEECNARGLEGVVAKRRDAPYRAGKSADYIKVKCAAWKAANRERGELLFG
jgi:hypothetical protein